VQNSRVNSVEPDFSNMHTVDGIATWTLRTGEQKVLNVLVEKEGEDRLDRSCGK